MKSSEEEDNKDPQKTAGFEFKQINSEIYHPI